MTIAEAHYQFKINMDRVDTQSNPGFRTEEIDFLLNEAQDIFIKRRITPQSNSKKMGFEHSQKRVDDLSTIVVKYPAQPYIIPTLDSGVYEIDLFNLAYTYLHLVSGKVELQVEDTCTKDTPMRFTQHDDYLVALRDPFNSPSTEFVPYNFGMSSSADHVSTSVYLYPGIYTINKVYLEYIKKPRRVFYGNYVYADGVAYPPTTFELPDSVHSEIVDIACELASMNVESPEYIRLKQAKSLTNE